MKRDNITPTPFGKAAAEDTSHHLGRRKDPKCTFRLFYTHLHLGELSVGSMLDRPFGGSHRESNGRWDPDLRSRRWKEMGGGHARGRMSCRGD